MPILGIDLRARSSPFGSFTSSKSSSVTVSEIRADAMDLIKRPQIPGLGKKHGSHDKPRSHDRSQSKGKLDKDARPAPSKTTFTLNMAVESPPALFIDSPQTSSGHLLSGRLQVTPYAKDVTIDKITMFLEASTTTKKPVADRCRECTTQVADLYEWNFLSHPKTFVLSKGMQEIPFSHLIPGHISATTHGHIGSVDYSLHVRAVSNEGVETEFRQALILKRALRPGPEKNSIRVFPPTNLSLHVTLPSVIHPMGGFPVLCRMSGITTKKDDIQTRWRLRKLTWHIEEQESMISPACSKHSAKVGGEGKGIKTEHTRDIGMEELRGPFKTDFDDGMVEGEFEASMNASLKPQCDVDTANGLKISHSLILELVIAEEWAPNRKPQSATPTGAARVLRTQFNLVVTERLGMGISWDDEQPPMYEDVPDSPPHYANEETRIEDYDGDDLHHDVSHLRI
ncbi:hypothetical protein AMS68_000466 [Peltaster fructicola]|uniref:LDB19 N-terminal domain-containing protein n=1 Tax=Peltaster fructicola TaxID=286661 RepID=A0A6H0XJY1_9PEZI|nr:hypothetical protein AMS68_000466 [Peltaster fructicola]